MEKFHWSSWKITHFKWKNKDGRAWKIEQKCLNDDVHFNDFKQCQNSIMQIAKNAKPKLA